MITTDLSVDVLKVFHASCTVLRILNVIDSHELVATGRQENAVNQVSQSCGVVRLISLVPQSRNIVGTIP